MNCQLIQIKRLHQKTKNILFKIILTIINLKIHIFKQINMILQNHL